FHHHMWLASTISTTSFFKGLGNFLDDQHKQPLLGRGSHRRRQLQIPFTHSAELYSRILMLKDEVFQASLELTTTQKWASSLISSLSWMAIINNHTTHMPAKIHLLKTNTLCTSWLPERSCHMLQQGFMVYKSGKKLYYPISILGRILLDFPSSRIGVLYDIGCQPKTHVFKLSIHYQSINCS
ncbi:uncharacterized protein VP01_7294g1, partial [Puccinia sorghi]